VRRYTDDEVKLMRELVGYGYSGKQIAAKLGRDPLAIRAKMVAPGLPLRPLKVNRKRLRIVIRDELWRGLQRAGGAAGAWPVTARAQQASTLSTENRPVT